MLISLTLENWMSFRDPVTFNLTATKERQHRARVPRLKKYRTSVLPIAALFGGNASGKSNLFKALAFAKKFVVEGLRMDEPIPVDPFRLDAEALERPVRIAFVLLLDETIYEYRFAVSATSVVEETLTMHTSTIEKSLFNRQEGKPNFDKALEDDQRLQFVFEGTRDNQLFLTNSVSQNLDNFKPVYEWFLNELQVVALDHSLAAFNEEFGNLKEFTSNMSEALTSLDTGIVSVSVEDVALDSRFLSSNLLRLERQFTSPHATYVLNLGTGLERVFVTRHDGKLSAQKLVVNHLSSDGTIVKFDFHRESDGSRRLIDVLPVFLDLMRQGSRRTYIIDEFDQSWHTLLSRQLLQMFLNRQTSESRSQLLFTTHDVLLMDLHLLRRDEMWVVERDVSGVSTLISFAEYADIRYNTDVRKEYLDGRLGGLPHMILELGFPPMTTNGNEKIR